MGKLCSESGSVITECMIKTPIGSYKVEVCERGLHSLGMGLRKDFIPNAEISVELDTVDEKTSLLKPVIQVREWLHSYFEDPVALKTISPPLLCFQSDETTEFERNVWNGLAATATFGTKLSYGELAEKVGHPKAARAVGSAMKKNPIALVIPCHRVIRSDGKIGNYFSGAPVKEWLLSHESRNAADYQFASP